MHERNPALLRPKTQTVSVYTRHSADCPRKGEPQWRRCKCAKYLYLLREGKDTTLSAKTRSWEKAEQQAQEIRDSWDPVKQRLRELDELKQARELGEVTITHALERWLPTVGASREGGLKLLQFRYVKCRGATDEMTENPEVTILEHVVNPLAVVVNPESGGSGILVRQK
jgi:hypothetical protein